MAEKDYKGKVSIVTGGSEGIGFGIASALAARGSLVYLIARTPEKLEGARQQILDNGGKSEIKPADITKFDQIKKVIDDIYQKNGRLDIFVNNAGTWRGHSIGDSFDEISKILDLDFRAPVEITHYLAQKFKGEKKNSLKILTVASQAALQVLDSGLGYGTAKMGLTSYLFHLENEISRMGIKNIQLYRLYPNTVATEKMLPAIKAGKVENPVKLESVVDAALNLLDDETPTRDVRIGYYPKRGIVRTYLPSEPNKFYKISGAKEEIVDSNFKPDDLFK